MLRLLLIAILRIFYRVRVHGAENLPKEGGVILVANHQTYVDAFLLGAACPRPVRFAMFEGLYNKPLFKPFLKHFGVIPISKTRAKEAILAMAEAASEGGVVALFPEGQLSRTGMMNEFKRGFEMIARRADVPVIPVAIDGLWGSIFSFERGRFFKKIPLRVPYRVSLEIGQPLPPREAKAVRVKQEIEALRATAFARRPVLQETLGYRAIRGLKKGAGTPFLIERAGSRQVLTRGGVLATASCLAKRWREGIAGERVGVLLPGGSPVGLVNLGLVLAGKIPVNLPPADLPNLRETLEEKGVTSLITSKVIHENFSDYPWPDDVRDLGSEVRAMSPGAVVGQRVLSMPLAAKAVARGLKIPTHIEGDGDGGEAVAFFMPDGRYVALTHRALVGNVTQLASTGVFRSNDVILSLLSPHDPGGLVFSLWGAALAGGAHVTAPLRHTADDLVTICDEERATAVAGHGEEVGCLLDLNDADEDTVGLPSLRIVLTPESAEARDAEDFDSPYHASYLGDLESGLIVTCSTADPPVTTSSAAAQSGVLEGAFGRLLPGYESRFVEGGLEIRADHLGDGDWRPVGIDGEFDADGFFIAEASAKVS